jgi:hypothetical protein
MWIAISISLRLASNERCAHVYNDSCHTTHTVESMARKCIEWKVQSIKLSERRENCIPGGRAVLRSAALDAELTDGTIP